jgi:hypothetical protein
MTVPLADLSRGEQDEVLRRVSLWAYYLLRPPLYDTLLRFVVFPVSASLVWRGAEL